MSVKTYGTKGAGPDLTLVAQSGMALFRKLEQEGPEALRGLDGVIIAGPNRKNDFPAPSPH